nr:hypothetical protein [Streptomyces sindenensis]
MLGGTNRPILAAGRHAVARPDPEGGATVRFDCDADIAARVGLQADR